MAVTDLRVNQCIPERRHEERGRRGEGERERGIRRGRGDVIKGNLLACDVGYIMFYVPL